jgi:phenylalanyl-tRNA synthetase beta chain
VHGSDETHVRVGNPLSDNEAFLRRSLLETLGRRAEYNLSQRVGDVRVFEIGSAFDKSQSAMPREQLRLGVLVMGRRHPPHFTDPQPPAFDEWDAKAVAEIAAAAAYADRRVDLRPGSGLVLWKIHAGGHTVGNVLRVELDAPVWALPAFGIELILGEVATAPPAGRGSHSYIEGNVVAAPGTGQVTLVGHAPTVVVSKFRALPTMPAAEIDLALLVPHGTTVADVERVVREAGGDLLEKLELFDQYTGVGVDSNHRSLAWRLTFRHPERTLRDKEIEGRRSKILGALEQELHVRQRSA